MPSSDSRASDAAEVDQSVAALGQRLHHGQRAWHPDAEPGVERQLHLGDRAQPPVDVHVRADHLHLEARDAALADLLDRVGHAVHRPDAVGHQRDAHRLVPAVVEPLLLTAQERGGRCVGDRRDAGLEQVAERAPDPL
jgi:hypothetical protein